MIELTDLSITDIMAYFIICKTINQVDISGPDILN